MEDIMQKTILAILLLIAVACTPQTPALMEKQDSAVMQKTDDSMMQKNDSAMQNDETFMEKEPSAQTDAAVMMKKEEQSMTKTAAITSPTLIAGDTSQYHLWNSALFEKANEEGKFIYLEFSANWCPVCKQQEKDLILGFERLANPNIIGFKIPYRDSETTDEHAALARKYGIAYQHTKVIVQNGNILLKSPEAWTTERFLTEVNKLG